MEIILGLKVIMNESSDNKKNLVLGIFADLQSVL